MRQSGIHQIVLAATAVLALIACGAHAATLDRADAVRLGRQYLTTHDSPERSRLALQLAGYEGDVEPIIKRLSARTYERATPGYHPSRHFSVRELRKRHPDELLYFDLPESYRPDTPTGLIVFMHGGDNTIAVTTRNVARFTVWLHPRMVDLAKPVVILVNGRRQFSGRVRPSLATALEPYLRRDDWGLIYPIKVELTVGPNPPGQKQGSLAEVPELTIMKLVQQGERR
ncbi:MAG: hypothetical protein WCB27_03735 [Thermoguttaceae bacterium]|jgi:hypothetical protein